jgi:ubiquinone/menaquinone biosynthesis C-methylase UbiE
MKEYLKKNKKAYSAIAPFYKSGEKWDEYDLDSINKFLTKIKKGGKILSIGSGTGDLENYISSKNFKTIGIDISEEMVVISKKKFKDTEFYVMNGEDLKFENEIFDAVVSRYASQHMDTYKFLNEISRVMKNGAFGWIMCHTSLIDNKSDTIEEIHFGWDEIDLKAIMFLPSSENLKSLISSKFKVIEVIQYPDRSKKMNDTLFIIKK